MVSIWNGQYLDMVDTNVVSIWTMVIITVDRYIAVCLPSEVQLRTVRRAKVAVAYISVLSVVCCLPLKVKGQGQMSGSRGHQIAVHLCYVPAHISKTEGH